MTTTTEPCMCRACQRVDLLHAKESEYGRRERMAAGAGDLKSAERYGKMRDNALRAAELRLMECTGGDTRAVACSEAYCCLSNGHGGPHLAKGHNDALTELAALRKWKSQAKNSFSLRDCRKCEAPVFPGHTCGYCGDDDSQ